jgi:protein phosphatase
MPASPTETLTSFIVRRPDDDELDVFGLTHPGKVRPSNQDHFLICSLSKQLTVHQTSLPEIESVGGGAERLAFFAMIADGVGAGAAGETASRLALEAMSEYAAHSMHVYYTADPSNEEEFKWALTEAAMKVHKQLVKRMDGDSRTGNMATTLTMILSVWPRAYILQVGDSRYYLMRDGELMQVTRDQTLAEQLVEQGVFSPADASKTPLAHVLSSTIGGSETKPVVTGIDNDWDTVHLMCSDGLTKHVSDEQIADRLRNMKSSRHACEQLVQDALDDGGSDNITIIVGRVQQKKD